MTRPRLLDLFCGGGGAAMGYYRAGFDVVGVDIKPMPRYPFEFHQADALEYCVAHSHEFDVIHASPPCQRYSESTPVKNRKDWPDLIEPIRNEMRKTGKPYIIENVENARSLLINPIMLCGSMFGLPIWRHRYFETPFFVLVPSCRHDYVPVLISGHSHHNGKDRTPPLNIALEAMELTGFTRRELSEAIPPAYTEFIGRHIMERL